jgi:hypothetical protein
MDTIQKGNSENKFIVKSVQNAGQFYIVNSEIGK